MSSGRPHPRNARVNLLQITPPVPQLLKEIREARAGFYANLLTEWPEADCRAFAELLRQFNRTTERRMQRKSDG
ncbi:hypothetical protein [Cohnella nanjingensis]|uniref:MarR family transcriptional regulator n=1 Tax=Cohnella nanjingensis TaxID=1387779 RepID=A0A7X0VGX3_9BACL|nr:hypothetical protein [Cohnella nanjingensis]MBB6673537.1 hypothetical protein [Cohnella nanjingensis]